MDQGSGTDWEYRLGHIATRYLKTWFALDLLSIVPSAFDIVPLVTLDGCARAHCRVDEATAFGRRWIGGG